MFAYVAYKSHLAQQIENIFEVVYGALVQFNADIQIKYYARFRLLFGVH